MAKDTKRKTNSEEAGAQEPASDTTLYYTTQMMVRAFLGRDADDEAVLAYVQETLDAVRGEAKAKRKGSLQLVKTEKGGAR